MKPGDITPAIRTPRGYQILKLESLKPQTVQPFDKVRDLIADKVAQERTRNEMRKFLTRLRAQAIIEWKNDELKKAYEKQVAADDAAVYVEPVNRPRGRSRRVVRDLDAVATRAGRSRAARAQGLRSVPPDDHALEPVEGPAEEDRLAAVSGLLLRALRESRTACPSSPAPASSASSPSTATSRRFPSRRSTRSGGSSKASCSTIRVRSFVKARWSR